MGLEARLKEDVQVSSLLPSVAPYLKHQHSHRSSSEDTARQRDALSRAHAELAQAKRFQAEIELQVGQLNSEIMNLEASKARLEKEKEELRNQVEDALAQLAVRTSGETGDSTTPLQRYRNTALVSYSCSSFTVPPADVTQTAGEHGN